MPDIILSSNGGKPIVIVGIGGPSLCVYNLFLQAPNSNEWKLIAQGDNQTNSTHNIVIDPQNPDQAMNPPQPSFIIGNSISAFNGWKFGWSTTFFGTGVEQNQPFELTIDMFQDGVKIMSPTVHHEDTFNTPTKSFNGLNNLIV